MAGTALKRLMAEYKQLTLNPPEGIVAGPMNEENFFEWEALIIRRFLNACCWAKRRGERKVPSWLEGCPRLCEGRVWSGVCLWWLSFTLRSRGTPWTRPLQEEGCGSPTEDRGGCGRGHKGMEWRGAQKTPVLSLGFFLPF
ncbi:ubiquitin-conjugating enzyme E2 G2 isoform X3 [Monodelphis domestica]|uniref:ubiquitin-conjugating enzyme E2 G2 isoform X3 n=1 Tax=Monodelphis domestica TaxID=13616 RepID=UPI0024E23E33|nr:ubiquitin-conjugating enzyme E2 G2 isoform X3 [Monodelphis domestica]